MISTLHALMLATTATGLMAASTAPYPDFGTDEWNALFAVDIAKAGFRTPPVPAPEAGTTYSITYKGEIAGFDVGRIFLDVAASPTHYEVGYRMEQRGIARWFSDAEARSIARGTFDQGRIASHYYLNHDYEGDDDQQYVELFRAAGSPRLHLWSEPQYDFFQPVSEEVALGAVDPMAALVSLGFGKAKAGKSPCERTVKVFDGRRRFDLVMTDAGTEYIRKGGKGRFEGNAYKCKLEQKKVAGYREKDKGDIEGDLWVYLSKVPEEFRSETFMYVPVMIVARRGIITARLEGKNPIITTPDGKSVNLGDRRKRG